jgi:hypothetical protein
MDKVRKPSNSCVIHHRQNPIESTWYKFAYVLEGRDASILRTEELANKARNKNSAWHNLQPWRYRMYIIEKLQEKLILLHLM